MCRLLRKLFRRKKMANKYITAKLDWAEKQLAKWEKYLDENPYDELIDRIALKELKNGGVIPVTAASIEQQQKNQRETMKEYLALLAIVKKYRNDEDLLDEKGSGTYGDVQESVRMKNSKGDG